MEQAPTPDQQPEKPEKSAEQRDLERNLRIIKYGTINAQHLEAELL